MERATFRWFQSHRTRESSPTAVEALESNLRDARDALAELEDLAESSAVESLRESLAEDSPALSF